MSNWQPIKTAPVGPTIIVGNENTGDVWPAYGVWRDPAPMPFWCSIEPTGTGYCKPTHWQQMPEMTAMQEVASE